MGQRPVANGICTVPFMNSQGWGASALRSRFSERRARVVRDGGRLRRVCCRRFGSGTPLRRSVHVNSSSCEWNDPFPHQGAGGSLVQISEPFHRAVLSIRGRRPPVAPAAQCTAYSNGWVRVRRGAFTSSHVGPPASVPRRSPAAPSMLRPWRERRARQRSASGAARPAMPHSSAPLRVSGGPRQA